MAIRAPDGAKKKSVLLLVLDGRMAQLAELKQSKNETELFCSCRQFWCRLGRPVGAINRNSSSLHMNFFGDL